MQSGLPDLTPRYRALRSIARGGASAVFEAQDLERDQRCAVKVLRVGRGDVSALL